MSRKRILYVWFPRFAVEHALRHAPGLTGKPVAIVESINNTQTIVSVTASAEARGIRAGKTLRDALALFPDLHTRSSDRAATTAFLADLCKFAEKFSPWSVVDGHAGLIIDSSGCAHLFGGENSMLELVEREFREFGLTVRAAIADTVGAAWALARYSGRSACTMRSGDDIEQEALATRSRASRRWKWAKNRPDQAELSESDTEDRIAPPDGTREALIPLPVASLRLSGKSVARLQRLGIRNTGHLLDLPRAEIVRRFDVEVARRIDQALGNELEPVSPARSPTRFAVRFSVPEPIGLEEDILAAIDRMLPELCKKLQSSGHGARQIGLKLRRTDNDDLVIEVGFARPVDRPDQIKPLLTMKMRGIDPGFGIDSLRLVAILTEPVEDQLRSDRLDLDASTPAPATDDTCLNKLIEKLGVRVGLNAITRLHPADSHIPEKTSSPMVAAWSKPAMEWPQPAGMRPLILFQPEIVHAPERPTPPERFRWRRRDFALANAVGPERIMPEWWLDDPNWRNGTRDYWRVGTVCGTMLWLFFAHGSLTVSRGWFCQGNFG